MSQIDAGASGQFRIGDINIHRLGYGSVDRIAKAHRATVGQVALAWLLQHSPVILPIPGTVQVTHLDEDVAAATLSLTVEEIAELDDAA